MEEAFIRRWNESNDQQLKRIVNATKFRTKLWHVCEKLRDLDAPHLSDEKLLQYHSIAEYLRIPILRGMFPTNLMAEPFVNQLLFKHIMDAIAIMDMHGCRDLATDADWETWIESL